MAATADNTINDSEGETEFCTIEASVVTGFEECARGEAREKFNTEVKAARGKITWKVPLERVQEVLKMGSIDNCRVLMHTVPCFKFTDQHDSLARLQKMVADVDWEAGLKAWGKFYDFPHPIAAHPDVIPPLEDLVDVVIMTRQPAPKDKSSRKNKKGGRGNRKDKKKGKNKDAGDQKVGGIIDGVTASTGSDKKDPEVEMTGEGRKEVPETKSQAQSSSGYPEIENPDGSKTVIIKKSEPGAVEPKIEIKVLIPGPNENAFPADLKDKDLRDLEPMEVDQSMNMSTREMDSSKDKDEELSGQRQKQKCEEPTKCSPLLTSKSAPQESRDKSAALMEKEFASSVIEKLTSPVSSPARDIPCVKPENDKDGFVTPPPTPVSTIISPFAEYTKDRSRHQSDSFDKDERPLIKDTLKAVESDCGSSVDPPAFPKDAGEAEREFKIASAPEKEEPSLFNLEGLEENAEKELVQASALGRDQPESNKAQSELKNVGTNMSPPSPFKELPPSKLPTTNTLSSYSGQSPESADATPCQEKSSSSSIETNSGDKNPMPVKRERDPTKPTFRVTCNRVGDHHAFDSSSAAASFGSAVITYHNWSVDLKNFDIEVLLNIDNEEVTVSIGITKTSLHNRNLIAFGPTTLRATICYNMLRLCRIKNGDFICDPMCGTSAIPIEGAMNWHNCFHIGGDFHEMAMERSAKNISALQDKKIEENKGALKINTVQWDIQHFPLRDKCIDVFISDLPFGYRMGSRTVNRTLYPNLLSEMARTARDGARACLLTEDRTSLIKAIQSLGRFWQRRLILSINMGGLAGCVFLLTRTAASYSSPKDSWLEHKTSPVETKAEEDMACSADPVPQNEDKAFTETSPKETDADGNSGALEGCTVTDPNEVNGMVK